MQDKSPGAFLTISELAAELSVPQHVLRYWETRFSQLRPMTRAGNRRYYRPADVDLARRIHVLLNQQGFTIDGAKKMLSQRVPSDDLRTTPALPLAELERVRAQLVAALNA